MKLICKNELENINNINDKYNDFEYNNINNFNIKLIDFGNSEKINNNFEEETIYTRCYRPPENIINEEIHLKSDLWFIGCLLYELVTNEVLFNCDNIEGDKDYRDKKQLEMMIKYLGNISKDLIFREEYYNNIFDSRGKLKNIKNEYDKNNLRNLIIENKKIDLEENELNDMIDFILNILKYNPNDRLDYNILLTHSFLK